MNKSTTLALRLLLISSAALGYTPAICGQNSTTWIQIQQNAISDRLVTIGIWEHDAQLQVNLIIAVIVFGAMVGVLQTYNRSWCVIVQPPPPLHQNAGHLARDRVP